MEDVLPTALERGIPYQEFWHLTPTAIMEIEKAHQKNIKRDIEMIEQQAWLTGQFVMAAIEASFSKKNKYPENPLVVREKKRTDFTEEEKEKYVKALFGQLDTMQKVFEKTGKKNKTSTVANSPAE